MTETGTVDARAVAAAAERIAGYVHRTPILRSRLLDAQVGAELHLKGEHLQRAGSFKARGAFHRLLGLSEKDRRRGVVTVSSGNHAGALAFAGQAVGVGVDVYMPEDAPSAKAAAAQQYGATIHRFERSIADRAALARAHAERHGSIVVPPFDDPWIIAGQGTVALELHADAEAELDVLVVPVSGGGLMAGCALASRSVAPRCRIVGVEPDTADDTRRSLAAGRRVQIDQSSTIADGLAVRSPGELTFPILERHVDEMVVVTDDEIGAAVRWLFSRTKQVVEPSGAASLAAVLGGVGRGRRVGVVLSGGNVDPDRFSDCLRPSGRT